MTRKLIQIPEELHKQLKLRAVELGITIPEVIKAALRGESGAKTPVAAPPTVEQVSAPLIVEPVPAPAPAVEEAAPVPEPAFPDFQEFRRRTHGQ